MNKYIPEKINAFKAYTPNTQMCKVVLDANESPFMPSQQVIEAYKQLVVDMDYNRYPDPMATEVVAAFAKVYDVPKSCVVASNGSDEIISVILSSFLQAGDTMLVATPDFSMYAFYGQLYDINVVSYASEVDFDIDFSELANRVQDTDAKLIIFSNPCNPTGRLYDKEQMLAFIEEVDALVVVDEAYADFAGGDVSLLAQTALLDNLIVLKTLSKAFGLAGIRLGFAVSNKEIIEALYKVKSPYNVNRLTQAFGKLVLEDAEQVKRNLNYIIAERDRVWPILHERLSAYGIRVYETNTNFILMDFGNKAEPVYKALLQKGTRIRFMPPYLRVTIGLREENDTFITQLFEILNDLEER